MNSKECKEKVDCVVKSILKGNKIQGLVLGGVEFILPVLVVLALAGCVLGAFQAAIAIGSVSGFFAGILAFIFFLVVFVVATLTSFYIIYAIKTIKDSVAGTNNFCLTSGDDNICCDSGTKQDTKATNSKSSAKKSEPVAQEMAQAVQEKESAVKRTTVKKETKPRTRKAAPKEE